MSRLDSFIRRMVAQRDILNSLAPRLAAIDGPIVELGLGNGRTFDHLRELFPGRRIVAFDRALASHPASRPDPDDLVLGEIRHTAASFAGLGAALVHADIESADPAVSAALLEWLPPLVLSLLAPGGFAVSGSALPHADLEPVPLPPGIAPGRYHVARRRSGL